MTNNGSSDAWNSKFYFPIPSRVVQKCPGIALNLLRFSQILKKLVRKEVRIELPDSDHVFIFY
jgi:hypothetical protein